MTFIMGQATATANTTIPHVTVECYGALTASITAVIACISVGLPGALGQNN